MSIVIQKSTLEQFTLHSYNVNSFQLTLNDSETPENDREPDSSIVTRNKSYTKQI